MHRIPQVMTLSFRRRQGNALRPVHRIKHVVDEQGGIVAGTTLTSDLIKSVDAPVLANTTEVETGSKVNGIYLRVEVYATSSGALSNVYMAIFKDPGANLISPNPNTVGSNDNKRFVIHQEMVMVQRNINGNPRTLFNGVIALPRGYRRQGPADRLQIILLAPGISIDYCFQCHYKEFR